MLAFVNANLIDGTGTPARKRQRVLVNKSRIEAIGRFIDIPEGTEVIDLKGKTLMPGLIDSHVHYGNGYRKGIASPEETNNYQDMRNNALAFGVTCIRSGGDYFPKVISVRDRINAGEIRGPRLIVCGPHIMRKEAHPASTMWGGNKDTIANCGMYPLSVQEAIDCVAKLADNGVDYIKIILSDSHMSVYPTQFPQIPDDVLRAICEEAQRRNLRTVAHVETLYNAQRFVDFGGNEVHHLMMTASERSELSAYAPLFKKMCENDVGLVPTMVIPRRNEAKRIALGRSGSNIDHMANVIRMAYDYGVLLGCGTDAGAPNTPWGPSLHGELDLYVDSVGLSPLEAIRSATFINAKLMNLEGKLGQIRVGAFADMLVLRDDPTTDILHTSSIVSVMKDGKFEFGEGANLKEEDMPNPKRSWNRF